jgi:predicted nucleotidyltransferase
MKMHTQHPGARPNPGPPYDDGVRPATSRETTHMPDHSMPPTPYPEVNSLLEAILTAIRSELGDKLLGLYVFGSLVTGDFNLARSDVDLAAVLTADLDDEEFARIERMHARIASEYPIWNDRIEVGYIAERNVRDFDPKCTIAITSPGEPFHRRTAEYGWLLHLDQLRRQGLVLYGPPPESMIAPIPHEEIMRVLKNGMKLWRDWTFDPEPEMPHSAQAYAIMTMCRALHTYRTGEFVSKNEAVRWAAEELPEWSQLIRDSVKWRESPHDDYGDPDDVRPKTLAFTRYVTGLIIDD